MSAVESSSPRELPKKLPIPFYGWHEGALVAYGIAGKDLEGRTWLSHKNFFNRVESFEEGVEEGDTIPIFLAPDFELLNGKIDSRVVKVAWPSLPLSKKEVETLDLTFMLSAPPKCNFRIQYETEEGVKEFDTKRFASKRRAWYKFPFSALLKDGARVTDGNGNVWQVNVAIRPEKNGSSPSTTVVLETKKVD